MFVCMYVSFSFCFAVALTVRAPPGPAVGQQVLLGRPNKTTNAESPPKFSIA